MVFCIDMAKRAVTLERQHYLPKNLFLIFMIEVISCNKNLIENISHG